MQPESQILLLSSSSKKAAAIMESIIVNGYKFKADCRDLLPISETVIRILQKYTFIIADHDGLKSDSMKLLQLMNKNRIAVPFILFSQKYDDKLDLEFSSAGATEYITADFPARTRAAMIKTQRLGRELKQHKMQLYQLQDYGKKYAEIFQYSPISIWEEDFSALKSHLDYLKEKGIDDFKQYFSENPHEIKNCLKKITVVAVNPETLKMHRATSQENFISALDRVITPQSFESFKEELIAIAQGKTSFDCESSHRTLAGDTIEVFLRWSIPSGYEDTMSKVFVFLVDITAEKKATRELNRLNANLQKEITLKTDENMQLQKSAIIGDMITGFIHNLRTPLTVLGMQSSFIPKLISNCRSVDEVTTKVIPSVNRLQKAVQKIDNMLDTLMLKKRNDRIDSKIAIDLNKFVERELDFLTSNTNFKHKIKKEVKLAPNPPKIYAIPSELSQIFYNLLNNSMDAMWQQKEKRLNISTTYDKSHAHILIEDNGPGIPEKNLKKLFDPFFTTKPSKKKAREGEPSGTGLGLHSVKQMVEANDGEIIFYSREGEGTKVALSFKSFEK